MAIQLYEPETEKVSTPQNADSTAMGLSRGKRARPLFDPPIVRRAVIDSLVKLNPKTLARNPVMFVVEVGAVLTTGLMFKTMAAGGADLGFELQIAAWLWFTVIFLLLAYCMELV